MLLSALLMAVVIQAPSDRIIELPTPPKPMHRAQAIDGAERCWNRSVDSAAAAAKPPARKLGDAPPAKAQYAVMRTIGGCPVATPMKTRQVGPPN